MTLCSSSPGFGGHDSGQYRVNTTMVFLQDGNQSGAFGVADAALGGEKANQAAGIGRNGRTESERKRGSGREHEAHRYTYIDGTVMMCSTG